MTRLTYKEALDALLLPMGFDGFERSAERPWIGKRERAWVRRRDDFREEVYLQYSSSSGMTADFHITDVETERLYLQIFPAYVAMPGIGASIAEAAGEPQMRWFKDDPSGPEKLAAMVRSHAEHWFDRVRTPKDQAEKWYGRFSARRGYRPNSMIGLALTLYRMREYEEAVAAVNPPPRRTANKAWVEAVDSVRTWLQDRIAENRL